MLMQLNPRVWLRDGMRALALVAGFVLALGAPCAFAQGNPSNFAVGPGDVLHISVFQNADLTIDTRVDDDGRITYPFAGSLPVGGRTPAEIEAAIAKSLETRDILKRPQVTVNVVQFRSRQVSVLGQVYRPGRYALDTVQTLSDILALAGGVTANGADTVVLSRREGDAVRNYEVDVPRLYEGEGRAANDFVMRAGDVVYVQRAPVFYIYGEVQRPGAFRLERDMTVMQALSTGGGPNLRGTQRGIRIHRRDKDGQVHMVDAQLQDRVTPDDVIYVRESLF